MTPLLSLIIPCHNHAGPLPRLLRSVAVQSLAPKMEVVIVDDCSDIPCAAPLLPNIQIIRLPEREYTKNARLAGMEAAQGEVIAFADADDALWGTDALEKNARLLLEKEADIVHFPCVEVNADHEYLREGNAGRPLAPILEGREIFAALIKNRVRAATIWSKLYSRRLVREILEAARRVRVRRYREDVMFNLLFFAHARRYVASRHTGYAHYAVNKDIAKAGGRMASCWYMLEDLLPYLEGLSVSVAALNNLRQGLLRYLGTNMRIFCENAQSAYPQPPAAMLEEFLEHVDFRNAVRIWKERVC